MLEDFHYTSLSLYKTQYSLWALNLHETLRIIQRTYKCESNKFYNKS